MAATSRAGAALLLAARAVPSRASRVLCDGHAAAITRASISCSPAAVRIAPLWINGSCSRRSFSSSKTPSRLWTFDEVQRLVRDPKRNVVIVGMFLCLYMVTHLRSCIACQHMLREPHQILASRQSSRQQVTSPAPSTYPSRLRRTVSIYRPKSSRTGLGSLVQERIDRCSSTARPGCAAGPPPR